ncbi:MAG: hypothetical protein NC079_08085 [Clostridium sp.]|nr:hypothetical protein [Acetatifactor muris]MCM1527381.1 hypothetical protein [Bacteroides sp.]MCM1563555.1 hypothetical protein [Clostridium sp.]
MIAGTIKNSVKMAMMDNQWQQKKASGALGRKAAQRELTPQERELARLQEQVSDIHKQRERADLDAKLKSGQELTAEEIEYLRRNDPQALKEYEEIRQQRKAYKEALRHCDSKEEVEQLKLSKMGQFMAQAKKISNNPNIPKSAKKAALEKILKFIACVQDEHLAFEKTLQYQQLPEKEGDEDRERRDFLSEEVPAEPATKVSDPEQPEESGTTAEGGKSTASGELVENTGDAAAETAESGVIADARGNAENTASSGAADNLCSPGEFVDLRL